MPWKRQVRRAQARPRDTEVGFPGEAKEEIDQAGCVYTARGFEFDYVGVKVAGKAF